MFVKQVSVFLENKPGRLFHLTDVLAKNQIDIFHITIAETEDYGVVRCVTKDNERVISVLQDEGFSVSVANLVCVEIADCPGALNNVLSLLSQSNVQVEYLYSFSRNNGKSAAILLKFEQPDVAIDILTKNGIKLITDLTK